MRQVTSVTRPPYPALCLSGFYATGILLSDLLRPWFVIPTGLLVVCSLMSVYALHRSRRYLVSVYPFIWTGSICLAVLASGSMREAANRSLPPSHVAVFLESEPESELRFVGRLAAHPVVARDRIRFDLKLEHVVTGSHKRPTTGTIRVSQYRYTGQPDWPHLASTDRVLVRGTLHSPPEQRNPADFDYGNYLRRRNLHATCQAAEIRLLNPHSHPGMRVLNSIRAYISNGIERHIRTSSGRALFKALLLGDKGEITNEMRTDFVNTGLAHLLALSGLHVFFIGMVLYGLSRPVLSRLGLSWSWIERVRIGCTLFPLLLYTFVTGASASVVRATFMATVFILAPLFRRSAQSLNTLGIAGLILLTVNPLYLFDIGFQLSFSAVGAIITLNPVIQHWIPERWFHSRSSKYALDSFTVSLAATLGTMPVVLYHFGQVAGAGLFLNMIAIPLTAGVICTGLVLLLTYPWVPFVADCFSAAGEFIGMLLQRIASLGNTWFSWTLIRMTVSDLWFPIILCWALMCLTIWNRPRLRYRYLIALFVLINTTIWSQVVSGPWGPTLDVLFFDVGQGDAALVTLPNGKNLLIDAGPRNRFSDQGERTILPHLLRQGVESLDGVVISHPHRDHLGGLPTLLRSIPVRRVIDNGQMFSSSLYRETALLLDSLHIAHRAVQAGDTLVFDPDVRIYVVHPAHRPDSLDDPNDASVVLRLVYGQTAFLFTGDAESKAESRILQHFDTVLQSDVVKVGHHGSITSSTPAFVSAVRKRHGSVPPLAVVSVARRNSYGLPDPEALEQWESGGFNVVETRHQGALWIKSTGNSVSISKW